MCCPLDQPVIFSAVPLFEKRAAVVQGKVEVPDSLGEGEETEDETGQHVSTACTVTQLRAPLHGMWSATEV